MGMSQEATIQDRVKRIIIKTVADITSIKWLENKIKEVYEV